MDATFQTLEDIVRAESFSGAVRVERNGEVLVEFAAGASDRANRRPNKLNTRFSVASGTKGLTAVAIMALIESGELSLATTVRSVIGNALPHVDEAVTIDHLLAHRSGVGDFLDEETLGDIDDHVLGTKSAHFFESPSDYLDLLNAHEQRSTPGKKFAYNNSGYVILSLLIEHLTGSFYRFVSEGVLGPAGMTTAGFYRSDDLPSDTALGYLKNGRSNVFHLPVLGAGDGGIFLTLADTSSFWRALFDGQIVSRASVESMISIVSVHDDQASYGRGFWIGDEGDHVWLEGMDAGVSFQSGTFRGRGVTYSILANTSSGAWALARAITAR